MKNSRNVTLRGFGILLALAPAICQGAEGGHSTLLTSLNYYSHVGTLLLTPRLTTSVADLSTSFTGDGPNGASTSAISQFDLGLSYGLLIDGLRVGISETELFSSQTTHFTNSTGRYSLSQSSGLSDPTFSATYRYFEDDQRTGLSGDISLSASPSFLTHDVATALQEGSEARGYGTMALSAPVYWWGGPAEVELSPAITRQFSGDGEGTSLGSTYVRSDLWVETLALLLRYHANERLYAQAGAVADFPYAAESTYANGTVRTTHEDFHVVPRINLGYSFTPSTLLDVEYDYTNATSLVSETGVASRAIESTLALRLWIEI
jgi:hypothetical protein